MAHDPPNNNSDEEFRKSVEAVREAIAEMEAGDRGVPFDEFVAACRKKYNLPPSDDDRILKG